MTRREARMLSAPSPVIQSVVRDAAAHRLLSTVESRPEMTMNRKGTSTQAGSSDMTNSKFTMPASAAWKPEPAARKPTVPMAMGTRANSRAAAKNERPMRSSRMEKARCQKHWSPNGPEIRPTAVGSPKLNSTSTPEAEVREVYSPLTEPSPARTVSRPPVSRRPRATRSAPPKRMMPSWTTSVATDALMPEKRE